MPTLRLDLSYDGRPFSGWAAQPGARTIEGELSNALRTVLRRPVHLAVAGRTDAGVHAWRQVASGEVDGIPPDLVWRLNGVLPKEIVVRSAAPADDGFDARRDARSRLYCYRVLASATPDPFERGRSLHWRRPLDRVALAEAAAALVGVHDFTAFTPTQTEHVRFERQVIRAEWRTEPLGQGPDGALRGRPGEILAFWIEADAFMRNMVRVLVGTMLEIADGGRSVAELRALLKGAPREAAGETAPAHGLYLADVRYGD